MPPLIRVFGLATALYSAAIIVKPAVLAKPCELLDDQGEVPPATKLLISSIGARDLASGLALMFARQGTPLNTAVVLRVAADLNDAVHFGLSLPSPEARRKSAAVAGGWAALCAAAGWMARKR